MSDESIYILATINTFGVPNDGLEELFHALKEVRRPDEKVYLTLSYAYHSNLKILRSVRGQESEIYASIIFLNLAISAEDTVQLIFSARRYFPTAIFVLYTTKEEYDRCLQELPPDWRDRFSFYYKLEKKERGLKEEVRKLLDQAKITALKKREEAMQKRFNIFISYSRTDKKFAIELVHRLRAEGLEVWVDKSEIKGGEKWRDRIHGALEASSLLILIISPESLRSEYVQMEYKTHLENNKPLIPILARPVEEIPPSLTNVHYIEFTNRDFEGAFYDLLASIHKIQKGEP